MQPYQAVVDYHRLPQAVQPILQGYDISRPGGCHSICQALVGVQGVKLTAACATRGDARKDNQLVMVVMS
jgi:hypothetical protein